MGNQVLEQFQTVPKISCIVPVYNVEKYLRRCVDSILTQTFTDFEVILVDDGSPDSSPAICDEYAQKDNRVHVIHKANGGVSSARNAGLDIAKGAYICFVDSDDWIECEYMRAMYESAVENNSDLVMCGVNQQKKNGMHENLNFNRGQRNILCKNRAEFLKVFVYLRERPERAVELHSPVNKLYCANLLNGIRFDNEMIVCEDYVFNLDYFKRMRNAFFLNKTLYGYSFNGSSATHSFNEQQFKSCLLAIEKTNTFYEYVNLKKQSFYQYRNTVFYGCLINAISEIVNNDCFEIKNIQRIQPFYKLSFIFFGGLNLKQVIVFFLFKIGTYRLLVFLYELFEKN